MTSLASRELPIPDHIDIFHLDEEAEPSERTALEAVIDVVREKVRLIWKLFRDWTELNGKEYAGREAGEIVRAHS